MLLKIYSITSEFRDHSCPCVCVCMYYMCMTCVICVGVLAQVASECIEGAVITDLCEKGDQLILSETKSIYKKEKNMKKGDNLFV